MVPSISPSTAIHAIARSFLARPGFPALWQGSRAARSQDDVAAAAGLSQLWRSEPVERGLGSGGGPLGRLQLVEHRLDPIERFVEVDDPALFDIFETPLHGGAELGMASFMLAVRSRGGIAIFAGTGWGVIVHCTDLPSREDYAKSLS